MPKQLDVKVALLPLPTLSEVLPVCAHGHMDYRTVKVQGPFDDLVEVLEGNLGLQEQCLPLAETAQ